MTDDEALQAMLDEPFARWQVYLHHTQRKLVERAYTGPTRISGGPGTGKTIVALHRVARLVDQLPDGTDRPILLTTFNRNLAADLLARLLTLGGEKILSRVDIATIDRLAGLVVREAGLGARRRHIDDTRAVDEWRDMLFELGVQRWDPEFLNAEWGQVILGQVLTSRADYFLAPRGGTRPHADPGRPGPVLAARRTLHPAPGREGHVTWRRSPRRPPEPRWIAPTG